MDKSINVTPQTIVVSPVDGGKVYTQAFMYKPPRDDLLSRRGELFALLSMQPLAQDIDAPGLAKHIFDYLQQHYYTHHTGGVLEALEACSQKALQHGGELLKGIGQARSQPHYYLDLQMVALVIWGKAFYYYRTPQIYLGQLQGGELIPLDRHRIGSEAIHHRDLLVLATSDFIRHVFKPFLQEQVQPRELKDCLYELRERVTRLEDPASTGAILLDVEIAEVPSEEEVIEIKIAEEAHGLRRRHLLGLHRALLVGVAKLAKPVKRARRFLSRLAQVGPDRAPNIYLKPRIPQSKTGRLTLAIFLAFMLIASVVVTNKYNRVRQERVAAEAKLQHAQRLLSQAKEMVTLNPRQAQSLLANAEEGLGEVLGINSNLTSQAQGVQEEVRLVTKTLYHSQSVQAQAMGFPRELGEKLFAIDSDRGVIDDQGKVVLKRESTWKNPLAVASYFGNLYLLDPEASQIHKYLALPDGQDGLPRYSRHFNYLAAPANLSNAVDLAIDGSVYVLFEDGKVNKYLAGKREEFVLNPFHPPFKHPRLLETNPAAKHLYLVQENAILVFDKEGHYQRQFEVENIDVLSKVILADDESSLWLFSVDQWYRLPLK